MRRERGITKGSNVVMIYHTVEETVGGVFVLVVGAVAHVVAQLELADAAPLVVAVRRRTKEALALLQIWTLCSTHNNNYFTIRVTISVL